MNFLLAVVLYMGILYFQGAETWDTTTVDSIKQELALPGMERIKPGSRILAIQGREPSHWDDVLESCLNSTAAEIEFRLLEVSSGERYTISFPTPDDSSRLRLAYSLNPRAEPRIGSVIPSKPGSR